MTPLNIRLGDPELDHIVNDSQAVAIAAGDGYEKRAAALLASAPAVRLGLSLDNHLDGFAGYEEIRAQAPDAEPDRERYQVSEDDLAVLMYTGGTTGLPKGVMLSHRNVLTAAIAAALRLYFWFGEPIDATRLGSSADDHAAAQALHEEVKQAVVMGI